jgi:Asp-tRNA(Asn)/Glu-tRNA(Gln) amidotransferase A subunit family amidase
MILSPSRQFTLMEGEHLSKHSSGVPKSKSTNSLILKLSTEKRNPRDIIKGYQLRIESRQPDVKAWETLDWDFVDRQISDLEQRELNKRGTLYGIPFGVKDIFDTADLPTACGSNIYNANQPAADAAAVARLRAAGAIVMGKTVSTEFAYWKPGKTRNPLDLTRTPGGSSAGSAAAVADNMVPFALGSQTAASTIRPASYCGIVGFKPTKGLVSTAGVKALASSMDTIGIFARAVDDVAAVAAVLTGNQRLIKVPSPQPPRLAVLQGPEWNAVSGDALAQIKNASSLARSAGAIVHEGSVPSLFESLAEKQTRLMAFEAVRELAHERHFYFDRLSQPLRELFILGESIPFEDYTTICRHRDTCLLTIDQLFGDADALLAPSTLDEAPPIEDGTGNPDMSRAWTLLGLPSITIPCGQGKNGLPLGLQIACRPRQDAQLISIARWFELVLASIR